MARVWRTEAGFAAGPWRGAVPARWSQVFEVFASDDAAAPAMLGDHVWDGETITFIPRYPPAPSLTLRAVLRPAEGPQIVEWFSGVPAPPKAPSTRVLEITPSAAVWPENILRFYITFSAPMRIGVAWAHIQLLDAAGVPVPAPFVEIDQELWDPEGRRLTILFDPARIKRGLVDHEAEGLPLVPGRAYTLRISSDWHDAKGAPLITSFDHTFTAEPAWRDGLDERDWTLTVSERLTIDFPRPLDAALALRAFAVLRDETEVPGAWTLHAGETRLSFQPDQPLAPGTYILEAANILEDIAGNRPGRPFDIDRSDPAQAKAEARDVRLSFEVTGKSSLDIPT
ncbi:MAG: Ig-like domain-containing protein [Caulobacteraceae bacterium]